MGKILEALANDNLCINPSYYKGSPEYQKAIKVIYETAEELNKKLNDEEKELFEKFCDAQSDETTIYQTDKFVRGYRLGVLITLEVLDGTSDFICGKGAE